MEWVVSLLYYIASFIFILSVIVFVHEFGHYLVAKISGVKIDAFSIGFGPEIWGFYDRSGTRWKFSALPLGGYVKMFGDIDPSSAPDAKKIARFSEEEKQVAFHTKPLYKKAAIVAAGPIANFVLAIVILTGFYTVFGKAIQDPEKPVEITEVREESAAEAAGLQAGDIILAIDNKKIDAFDQVLQIVSLNTGAPLSITLQRGSEELVIEATPALVEQKDMLGNDVQAPQLGILVANSMVQTELGFVRSMVEAVKTTYVISASTLTAIGQVVTGDRGLKELSGPIRIAQYSGQSFEQGFRTVLWFMVVLSVNLGLINLFPIPVLDGGHLLYYSIEALQGKPLADRVQEWGFRVGIAMILCLAIFTVYNDLRNLNVF